MKLFHVGKDGGPESNVTGFWLIEWKRFFSVALLRFSHGSREAFHSHAFNCVSWLLKGRLVEEHLPGPCDTGYIDEHEPSLRPIRTFRGTFHRVFSVGTSWVLTFRGPWSKTWKEYSPASDTHSVLSAGRKIESCCKGETCS